MNEGKTPGRVVRGEFGNAPIRYRPPQLIPRDELLAIFDGAPALDYDELRADLDRYVDPSPWCWDDWAEWAARHIGRDRPADD